jgi:hypothetical protein
MEVVIFSEQLQIFPVVHPFMARIVWRKVISMKQSREKEKIKKEQSW